MLLGQGLAHAGTLTITSPAPGGFLGSNSSAGVALTGVTGEVRVAVEVVKVDDASSKLLVEANFSPNAEGKVEGTLPLAFGASYAEGEYKLSASAKEAGNPANAYPSPPPILVRVDVTAPRWEWFSPADASFVKGDVRVRGQIQEPYLREWRVLADGLDIPGGSGPGNLFSFVWNAGAAPTDGEHTLTFRATDEAGNQTEHMVSVTLDRVKPSIEIRTPTNNSTFRPGTTIPVAVDVTDQFTNSLTAASADVQIWSTSDRFLGRVARSSYGFSGSKLVWNGRLRASRPLPSVFKIVVFAWDRAGNQANRQETLVRIGSTSRFVFPSFVLFPR